MAEITFVNYTGTYSVPKPRQNIQLQEQKKTQPSALVNTTNPKKVESRLKSMTRQLVGGGHINSCV